MNIDFDCTKIFLSNYNATEKIVINRGGTRSSKTYSLLQLWVLKSFESCITIAVCRKTFPALRLTALNDFLTILNDYDLMQFFNYHKTEHTFTNKRTGAKIYFLALDNSQKIRGLAPDIVHLEEANEIPYETFRQIILRLKSQIYISFNPSDENIWINRELEQKRTDIKLIQSSYLDNAFLQPEVIKEIEYLKTTDLKYWQVFGLGEYGALSNKVYPKFNVCTKETYNSIGSETIIGLDFGYVDATCAISMKYKDGNVYLNELLYKSYLDNPANEILNVLESNKLYANVIYADHQPANQNIIRAKGYKVINAWKDIEDGLSFCRMFNLHITETSKNLIREIIGYHYITDHNNNVTNKPIDLENHALDAMRYAIYSHLKNKVFKHGLKTHN
jgi:phage terminase large subunit